MDFELNFEEEGFCLNLAEIARSRKIPSTIRLLAHDMLETPYMSIGEWLQGLDNDSFAQLHMLRSLLVFMSLEKKGLVRCYYENFTLGSDMGDKIVVDKL